MATTHTALARNAFFSVKQPVDLQTHYRPNRLPQVANGNFFSSLPCRLVHFRFTISAWPANIVAISCKHLLTKMPLRMHHCTPFQMKNLPKFYGKGVTTPSQTRALLDLDGEGVEPSTPRSFSGRHTFGYLPAPMII